MKTTIITVRHGETEWNKLGKLQGHLDSNLTNEGTKQANILGKELKNFSFSKIISSDLGRAKQTANIINNYLNKEIVFESDLRERNFGIHEGLTRIEFSEKYPEEFELFNKKIPDYKIPKGESLIEKYQRTIKCTEKIALDNLGKTILIVVHGGVIMSYMYKALNIPLNQKRTFSINNCSINSFTINENTEWYLDFWGDISHLRNKSLNSLDDDI